MPGEGKDRVFRVQIKWVARVSLYALEEALEGRSRTIPYDAIQVYFKINFHFYYYSFSLFFNDDNYFVVEISMIH